MDVTGTISTTEEKREVMSIQVGGTYKDVITGFEGVAIGHVVYLTGCNQTLLQPEGKDSAVRPVAEWFDDQRLQLASHEVIKLDNSQTPGCDRMAPKR